MKPDLVARLEPLESLEPHREAWLALTRDALEPNPFYAPDFLLAAVSAFEKRHAVSVLTLWRGPDLVGLLPLHRPNWREGMPLGVVSAYWNPYICLSTPLIATDRPEETLDALFARLDQGLGGACAVNFPALPLHRAVGRAMAHGLERGARPHVVISHHARALLAPLPDMDFRDYVEQESAEARKSFRRRETRLMALGALDFAVFETPGEARAKALEQFLTLEASGWKGRHRTALINQPDTRAFMAQAFRQEGALDYEIERLSVDHIPVAMSLNLRSHGVIHTFKQAYDETWRPFAPGKLLDRQAIRRAIESAEPITYDSCALPGYPIEAIWHERMVIAHKLVGLGKAPQAHKLDTIARRAMRIQKLIRRVKRWHKALMGSSAPKSPAA